MLSSDQWTKHLHVLGPAMPLTKLGKPFSPAFGATQYYTRAWSRFPCTCRYVYAGSAGTSMGSYCNPTKLDKNEEAAPRLVIGSLVGLDDARRACQGQLCACICHCPRCVRACVLVFRARASSLRELVLVRALMTLRACVHVPFAWCA